jgi:arylformamidase
MHNWIDISTTIKNGMVHWPGDAEVKIKKEQSMQASDECNVTTLQMSAHTGTHVDAPLHFIASGTDASEISLEKLIGVVKIFDIENPKTISLEEVRNLHIEIGCKIIFKTKNSNRNWSEEPFNHQFVYLSTEAAQFLVDKNVQVIGVDYLSVAGEENGSSVHRILLNQDILIIEGLALQNIEPGNYEMICLPLKIKDADGAPARVIIRKINDFTKPI